jgi:hypothetical protein
MATLVLMLGACGAGANGSGKSAGPSCQIESGGCACTIGDQSNTFSCTTYTVQDGICCADNGWPTNGSRCSCDQAKVSTCTLDDTTLCICYQGNKGLSGSSIVTSCAPPAGGVCCHDNTGDYCSCHTFACDSTQYQVDSCGPDPQTTCPSGKTKVTFCSM